MYVTTRRFQSCIWRTTIFAFVLIFLFSGCAISYVDRKTGIEHLWGVGHLQVRMSEPQDGVKGVVRGWESAGLTIGLSADHSFVGLGFHRCERLMVLDENTALWMDRPLDGGLFTIRLSGSGPVDASGSGPKEKTDATEQIP